MHHLGQRFPVPSGVRCAAALVFPAVLVRSGRTPGTAPRIPAGADVPVAAGTAAFPGRHAHRIPPTRRFR